MLIAEMLADDQTKTDALIVHLMHILELTKLFEKELLIFLADPNARVLNLDQDAILSFDISRVYLDESILICELQCIFYQVDHHLLKAHLVSDNQLWERLANIVDKLLTLHFSMSLEHQIDIVENIMERKGNSIQIERSFLYLCQIE